MRSNKSVVVAVSSAAASAVAGFMLGRKRSSGAVRRKAASLVGGNVGWMTADEQCLVSTLASCGQAHLFRNWPAPGVRDDQKRALLRAAASRLGDGAKELEPARLALLSAPLAAKKPKTLEMHGDVRVDDYYWLRDDDRSDADVLSYLSAENEYTKAALADTETLQGRLYSEMRGRIQEADQSVPVRSHGFYYYTRTEEGQQYKVHCRRAVPPGAPPPSEAETMDQGQPETVLLDENARKEENKWEFYMVGTVQESPDQRLLAWSEDTVGGEKYTLHVKDIATGKEITTPIPETSGDVMWGNDNTTLFYVVKDELDRPYKVFRHTIGAPGPDTLVYHEADDSFYVGISRSRSEKMLFIESGSAVTSEIRYLRADTPLGDFAVILPRVTDVEYRVSHRGDAFFLLLRDPSRPNSELRAALVSDPSQHTVLRPHSEDIKLECLAVSRDYLALFERSNALQRAVVFSLPASGAVPGQLEGGAEVAFEEPAYELSPGSQGDFDSSVLRLSYSSLTTPESTIDHDMASGKRAVKKVQPVLGGFDKAKYVTERLWATAPDGVKVPISLVYRRDLVHRDSSAPCLLDGYGAYEITNDPYFSSARLSLLDRGFVFAIAHVRGGGEMGRRWYETGKYLSKKNTFTDFIACAEHLVAHKYTAPAKLTIEGRSAGGLLIGAVVNMRPDLFNAAILGVPFVDVLTTIQDETIPLTVIEWEEWGNPKADKTYYDYIKSYSPVDNVRAQAYPNLFIKGGLHDPRVGYWEPAKFAARVRDLKTDPNLLLLKTEMGAGHFSVTGRFERLKEVAEEYAFLLKTTGLLDRQPAP